MSTWLLLGRQKIGTGTSGYNLSKEEQRISVAFSIFYDRHMVYSIGMNHVAICVILNDNETLCYAIVTLALIIYIIELL